MADAKKEEDELLDAKSSNPIIKKQRELYFAKHQRHMTVAQINNLIERIIILQQLYFQDQAVQSKYNNIEFWESISDGLHVNKENHGSNNSPRSNLYKNSKCDIKSSIPNINNQGYDVISFMTQRNKRGNDSVNNKAAFNAKDLYTRIQNTILNLRKVGFPPSFIFLYDAWRVT